VVVTTPQPKALVTFLEDMLGVVAAPSRPAQRDKLIESLGWPEETTDSTATLVGEGAGMMEVVGIPPSVAGRVPTGLGLVGFAVRDVDAVIARCREHGYEATDPVQLVSSGRALSQSFVHVAGITVELLSFGAAPAAD
jgi:hypothetical protein